MKTAWGWWACTQCGNQNVSGKYKRCPSCGDPRQQHELDAMRPPSDFREHITDKDELAIAMDGADWHCGFCRRGNQGSHLHCVSCGASREDTESMGKVGPVGGERPAPMPPRPTGGTGHPEGAEDPFAVDIPKFEFEERPYMRHEPEERIDYHEELEWDDDPVEDFYTARDRRKKRMVWGIFGAIAALTAFLVWGFWTYDAPGVITGMSWEHNVHLEEWAQVTDGGWAPIHERREVPPIDGGGERAGIDITSCRQKHHHDERYSCGTESYTESESYQCGTTRSCSTRNNGNGSYSQSCTNTPKYCTRPVTKTRTKYCTRPIYEKWCDYRTQRWVRRHTATRMGGGHEYEWPEVATPLNTQRAMRTSKYVIIVTTEDGAKEATETVNRATYDRWDEGDPVTLRVRNFGNIAGVREFEE